MSECIVRGLGGGEIVSGYYTGDGAASKTINLGFTPAWVLVIWNKGIMNFINGGYYQPYGGLAVKNSPAVIDNTISVKIVSGGFQVFYSTEGSISVLTNYGGNIFNYIAGK